jgi:hypothetical protein
MKDMKARKDEKNKHLGVDTIKNFLKSVVSSFLLSQDSSYLMKVF